MTAPQMTPHDWARIVARAQEAHWLGRWADVMRAMGDTKAANSLDRRAERAEAAVLRLAAACGAEVVEPVEVAA